MKTIAALAVVACLLSVQPARAVGTLQFGPVTEIVSLIGSLDGHPSQLNSGKTAAVWSLQQSSNFTSIQGYDFVNQALFTVTPSSSEVPRFPDISERRVVWSEGRSGRDEILAFDIDTGVREVIAPSNGNGKSFTAIDGQVVVWVEIPPGRQSSFYGAIGPNWNPFPIADSPDAFNGDGDVNNGRVFYSSNNPAGVTVKRLSDGETLFTDPRQAYSPDSPTLTNNLAAWRHRDDLLVADLASGQVRSFADAYFYAIEDDLLVYYERNPNIKARIMAVDLRSGELSMLRQLNFDAGVRGAFSLTGRRLTWIERYEFERYSIFTANIPVPEPSTMLLALSAATGLLLWRRQR